MLTSQRGMQGLALGKGRRPSEPGPLGQGEFVLFAPQSSPQGLWQCSGVSGLLSTQLSSWLWLCWSLGWVPTMPRRWHWLQHTQILGGGLLSQA